MAARVAVLSDSHVGQRISVYPDDFLARLKEFDLIIHAGDHTNAASYAALKSVGEIAAVRGNMDEIELSSKLPARIVLDIEGMRVGVIHGWGSSEGLAEKVRQEFGGAEGPVDIIIFGHSHRPCDEIIAGVRMLNPGAFSGNLSSDKGSWGILTIRDGSAEWEIVAVE
jgi:putative phosphoesterase